MPPKRRKKMVDVGDEYESQERDSHWHVSRSVPLAFILTMIAFTLAQTGTAAWFASAMNFRVDAIEKAQAALLPTANTQGERLTRLEEKVESVKSGITDIKTLLTAQDNRDRMMNSGIKAKQ